MKPKITPLTTFFCILLTMLLPTIIRNDAMAQSIKFQTGYGTTDSTSDAAGSCVQQTFDGGYITTGYISNFGGGSDDFYLVKTDSHGNVSWTKTYGGANADDANYVIQTADSGYAMVGPSFSYGGQTILLIKTDASGTITWSKTYGTGDSSSDASASSFKQTNDGGYIITGYVSNYGAGNDDYYLVKTTSTGAVQWTKTYGGARNDDANSVAITNDGGYIICGVTKSFADSMGDIYLVKTDSLGNEKWSKTYGSNDEMDMGNSVQQTTDHGYIIAGVTMGAQFGEFAILIKTDSVGTIQWTKAFGIDTVASDASVASVEQTFDGGYILTGYISNFGAGSDDYFLIKTNATGDTIFTKTYGSSGADDALFVKQTSDKGFIIAGKTFGYDVSGGGQHLYLVKTDSLGNGSCNQYATSTTINGAVTFTQATPVDSVSSGGIATSVTPIVSNGGVASNLCSGVGIPELANSIGILVYPNPANTILTIHQPQSQLSIINYQLQITDITGREIYKQQLSSFTTILDVSKLSNGIYLYQIISTKEVIQGKFAVER